MNYRVISHEEIADRWHEIKPFVEKALVHGLGDVTAFQLFTECLQNISQCWVVEEEGDLVGVAITRILTYVNHREIVVVTGTTKDWPSIGPQILSDVEDFGREMGCKYSSVYGRKGWIRRLKSFGYFQPYTVLTKEL